MFATRLSLKYTFILPGMHRRAPMAKVFAICIFSVSGCRPAGLPHTLMVLNSSWTSVFFFHVSIFHFFSFIFSFSHFFIVFSFLHFFIIAFFSFFDFLTFEKISTFFQLFIFSFSLPLSLRAPSLKHRFFLQKYKL